MKEKRNIFSFSSINIRSDNNINNKILDLKFPKIKLIDNNNFNSIKEFKDYNKTRKGLIKTDSNFFLSRNRMKKNNLKNELMFNSMKKYNSHENIKNSKKKREEDETKDFSIIKSLDRWDKEHCYINKDKENVTMLYKNLINYYHSNNLINEEKNIRVIYNMLKSKPSFKQYLVNGIASNNKFLKELMMRSPTKRIILNEEKKNHKNKDQKYLYKSHLSCNDINKNNNNNEDAFTNLLNKKEEESNINDFFSVKIKKEKLKYEKDLYQKLLHINNLLFNKKFIKEEKKNELEGIYETKNRLIVDYHDKFNKDIKQYWLRYDEYDYNFKKKIEILTPGSTEEISIKKKASGSFKNNYIKNMEYIKKNRINYLNSEMLKKQKELKKEYIEKFKEINDKIINLEKDLKIINDEISYYKHINDELLRECKTYYLDILKKGVDIRKDGLLWVVKNLIELQVNLEYQHFPKYFTHEQIDFLKNLAFINLEENELKIIISVLKKRQSNERMNDNIKRMNLVDALMTNRKSSGNNNKLIKDERSEIEIELTKRFNKIYQNNENALRITLDKNEEDIKIKNILIQIKKGLYTINDINQKKNNFINDNKNSILDAFMGKTKDKDLFSLILSIRNRLNELDYIKKNMIQKEEENYLDSIKVIGHNPYVNKESIKETIRKSLFGLKSFE